MPVNAQHERYLDLLFDRVQNVRYPSHHVLARIEAAITDRATAQRYVDMLLQLAAGERYPSLHLIDRAGHVMRQLAFADHLQQHERDAA